MSDWLNTPMFNVLEKSMDAASLRQKVLADNIANVDTPDFKRSDVDFDTLLGQAIGKVDGELPLKVTAERHLQKTELNTSGVVNDESTTYRNDGNNVDIDREMVNVAENGIYYNSVTRAISAQLSNLRTVIGQR
ncbi:flagellar basal-body rod protein FlgB [Desulfitobacterium dichloroeliminans LMG P-21439]|uniref:Flagellar basal body rod protein FlgB n=1 Tax=Desulfitobacterium dichloroeliminans (strain LMG P-21439 / DCA1) TaxID=871963 RepID=L0FAK8_DESDL|nr:flagellar basal body rod protein FlgB [Desulfitobacterium dichloroeliminans]AGA70257.1 flagellar basal-body rod protein FlgB [Desulfitobacterium dichloroeliminans LMG P-21439]